MEEAAQERHKAEVRHAYAELLHMEDWSGASRDRFLGVKANTAFEQRLKQVSMILGHDLDCVQDEMHEFCTCSRLVAAVIDTP